MPTLANLQKAALKYLERYAASQAMVRMALRRRIKRAQAHYPDLNQDETETWITTIIGRLVAARLLDDATFAAQKMESLRRQGRSAKAIRLKLRQKGVAVPEVEEGGADDLAAARRLAKKKRLGPWRAATAADTPERRRKEFAALARAGFSYALAVKVLKSRLEDAENTGDWD